MLAMQALKLDSTPDIIFDFQAPLGQTYYQRTRMKLWALSDKTPKDEIEKWILLKLYTSVHNDIQRDFNVKNQNRSLPIFYGYNVIYK